jgi:hypothetical protein
MERAQPCTSMAIDILNQTFQNSFMFVNNLFVLYSNVSIDL